MRRPRQVFLALLIALLSASLPTAVALAQLPQFPNTFYGNVTTDDGQPAPVGVVVTAVVDRGVAGSEKRYSLPITEPGKYGTANGPDPQLAVGGDKQGTIAPGSIIQFFLSTGTLPGDITGLEPAGEQEFFDDGNPQVSRLDLAGAILDTTGTPTPTPTPTPPLTPTPTPPATTTPRDDNDRDSPAPTPTATPQPAAPTSPSQGGGGGQPTPTATPFLVPTTEPLAPTPVIVVVAPPQVPTPTPEPDPTQQPAPTLLAPTPTVSLAIDEPITGGGGEDGGFPWWGWVLIVLGAGAATAGVALYYLRT